VGLFGKNAPKKFTPNGNAIGRGAMFLKHGMEFQVRNPL